MSREPILVPSLIARRRFLSTAKSYVSCNMRGHFLHGGPCFDACRPAPPASLLAMMTNPPGPIVRRHIFWALPALFAFAAMAVQIHVGAFATDHGQTSDEAAHFVTSLMLA